MSQVRGKGANRARSTEDRWKTTRKLAALDALCPFYTSCIHFHGNSFIEYTWNNWTKLVTRVISGIHQPHILPLHHTAPTTPHPPHHTHLTLHASTPSPRSCRCSSRHGQFEDPWRCPCPQPPSLCPQPWTWWRRRRSGARGDPSLQAQGGGPGSTGTLCPQWSLLGPTEREKGKQWLLVGTI